MQEKNYMFRRRILISPVPILTWKNGERSRSDIILYMGAFSEQRKGGHR